jgi:predicted NAD/FAD-binding protein
MVAKTPQSQISRRKKIAIVGSGAAGLSAAWMLNRGHDVTLFEAAPRLGGHANTVWANDKNGEGVAVDTGFIVYNDRNYPNFVKLLAALGVKTTSSDMSFSVSLGNGDFEYAGSLRGLMAQPTNLFRPDYWRMIADMRRFFHEGRQLLHSGVDEQITLGEFLSNGGYGPRFTRAHILPMGAAIWSASVNDIETFPLASFLRFFENHGLLQIADRPRWRTVAGGSANYVEALSRPFADNIRTSTPVAHVRPDVSGTTGYEVISWTGARENFDDIVFATHGDTTLKILGVEATDQEQRLLGAFRYQENRAILHRDSGQMPKRRAAWASWNYLRDGTDAVSDSCQGSDGDARVGVTYWMNRLQKLDSQRQFFVTLNPIREPECIEAEFNYDHPIFDWAAIQAQRQMADIQGRRGLWFCGSYTGYGFHEDAVRSGLTVAAALGSRAPWMTETPIPAVQDNSTPGFVEVA